MDLESDSMPEVPEEIIQLSGPVLLFVPPYLLFKRLSKHCNLNPVASACAAFLRFPTLLSIYVQMLTSLRCLLDWQFTKTMLSFKSMLTSC